ncbi:MAG: dihydrofolate reductase family protein, partial [Actinomycetota bacterium]|nr:dihydrofolate reductase family protein [Actinomycetota bacterium]
GVGTVLQDDPQMTVRMVPGVSPLRIVLDSTLRIPLTARILDEDATTIVLTTEQSGRQQRKQLRAASVGVRIVAAGAGGVDVTAALALLHSMGVRSLLVEGGAKVITSMLAAGVADRLIVGMAPTIIGAGTEAVGDLGTVRVADGVRLTQRRLHVLADDLIIGWDVNYEAAAHSATAAAP